MAPIPAANPVWWKNATGVCNRGQECCKSWVESDPWAGGVLCEFHFLRSSLYFSSIYARQRMELGFFSPGM